MERNTNLGSKRQRSLRLIVIAGISVMLAVSFAPSRASSKITCSGSKVIFFPNGEDESVSILGSSSPATTQTLCSINGVVSVPKFYRAGYTLSGWTGEPDQGSSDSITALSANSETWTANAVATRAYAQWRPIQYTVSYNYDGGSGSATATTSSFNEDIYAGATISSGVYSFATPTKAGYRFLGWSFRGVTYALGALVDAPPSDVAFTAVWVSA
jgi:hypothetical protein